MRGPDWLELIGVVLLVVAVGFFSAAETTYYYTRIRELCAKYGLRFSTCYIGNDAMGESFQRYQPLWSNRADCCDAVGNVSAFQTTCASLQRPSFIPLAQVAPGT